MIVCICRRISDHRIARAAEAGLDFDAVQLELGVATQCGQCETDVRRMVSGCSARCQASATKPAENFSGGNPWHTLHPAF